MASILITGASSGIGRELVIQSVRNGHQVWGISRHEEKLRQLALELPGNNFFYCRCDVTKPEELLELKNQMDANGFHPGIWLLNAGVTSEQPEVNHKTNLYGIINTWNAFKADIQQQSGIVAVSGSIFALVPATFNLSYSQSKLDALNFLKSLHAQEENCSVKFNYFVLGPVNTERFNNSGTWWKSFLIPTAQKTAQYMLKHLGRRRLIHIFPISSQILIQFNSVLPKSIMTRLMVFLKR